MSEIKIVDGNIGASQIVSKERSKHSESKVGFPFVLFC